MQKVVFYIIIIVFTLLVSCVQSDSQKNSSIVQDYDSLQQEKEKLKSEINNYFNEIETIEENLSQIEELEWFLSIQSTGENINNNVTETINKKIDYISLLLRNNAVKVDSLKNQYKNSLLNISGLEKTISRLTRKISEQSVYIEQLKNELTKRDELILQRDIAIKGMANSIELLEDENAQKDEIIEEQSQTIHTAYYVFGTYKELKQQKILTNKGLFSKPKVLQKDFNRDFFLKIDTREVVSIPLYSKKIKIHTPHSSQSYTLEETEDSYVLKILDPIVFWEVSKYLVIEVD